MRRILWYLCCNGRGHIYRALNIVKNLAAQVNNLDIDFILIADTPISFLPLEFKLKYKISYLSTNAYMNFDFSHLDQSYDLVISDNLLRPLNPNLSTNKLFIGSFIWSRIDSNYSKYSMIDMRYHENHLLAYNTHIVTSRYFLSPVLEKCLSVNRHLKHGLTNTSTIQKPISTYPIQNYIYVTFGGSAYAHTCLHAFVNLVKLIETNIIFILDQSYINFDIKNLSPNIFYSNYSYKDSINYYSRFIIRPGLGVLNDLLPQLKYRSVNIMLGYEQNNSEMIDNAQRLQEIGVCDVHNLLEDTSLSESLLKNPVDSPNKIFDCNGITQIVEYINQLIQ